MPLLILVRHAETRPEPFIPPWKWPLTKAGRRHCQRLANRLVSYQPDVIISSDEVKAIETAERVAKSLDRPCMTAPGLQEHQREPGEIYNQETWLALMARFFKNPDDLVLGLESANQAKDRFSGAIQAVMGQHPGRNIAIVSHGTVMSLYYQALTDQDAFEFWCKLGTPAFYTVSWPGNEVLFTKLEV